MIQSTTGQSMNNSTTLHEKPANDTSPIGNVLIRSKIEVFAFIILYVLLALIIIAGNILVVVGFRKFRLRTAINMFFVSLAVSDLLVGAVSIPLWIYILSCPYFTASTCAQPKSFIAVFYQSFDVFSALASISNLVAISVERYLAICWPIRHRLSTFGRYYLMIFITWSYSSVITTLYSLDLGSTWQSHRGLLVFVAGFAFPLIIVTSMYSSTFDTVRRMETHWRRNNAKRSSLRKNVQREKRTASTVVIVTVLFIISWLPFFVVSLLWTFNRSYLPKGTDFIHLFDFIKWMHYSNSAVNPVVYAYRSAEIRHLLMKLVLGVCGEKVVPPVRRPEHPKVLQRVADCNHTEARNPLRNGIPIQR